MDSRRAIDLSKIPFHLGLGATIVPQEPLTGEMSWYERHGARVAADGREGRLVTLHTCSEPWSMWEMHPRGHALVLCSAADVLRAAGPRHSNRRMVSDGSDFVATKSAPGTTGYWCCAVSE